MKFPDLWHQIACLNTKEINRFKKFLNSPYYNNDDKHRQLFQALLEQIKAEKFDRQKLDELLFPSNAFSYTRITNLISDLKNLLESFFVQEQLKQESDLSEYLLMKTFSNKHLKKQSRQCDEKLQKRWAEKSYKSEVDFLRQYQIQDLKGLELKEEAVEGNRKLIGKKIKSLHLFYVAAMLKSVCQDLQAKSLDTGFPKTLPHKVFVQYIQNNYKLFWREDVLRIYIRILRMYLEPDNSQHFQDLKDELFLREGDIETDEVKEIFSYALVYCSLKSKENGSKFKEELLGLYQIMLPESWVHEVGELSYSKAKEILCLAVSLNELEWANQFIETYAVQVEKSYRELARVYLSAYLLHCGYGKTQDAWDHINKEDIYTMEVDPDLYVLMLRVSYDLYKDEELETLSADFASDLKKNKGLSAEKKESYLRLVKYIKRLQKLRRYSQITSPSSFGKKLTTFKQELSSKKEASQQDWLLKKVDSLEKD